MTTSHLSSEIKIAARSVSTDDFSMTIGEIVNLYRDEDLIINPNFQRFFRWDIGRKSMLIESILMRIPIPPIFVFEIEDGKWELIDGLQRISTILEFMGELKDPDTDEIVRPLPLSGTQYLPSLHGAKWDADLISDDETEIAFPFDSTLQRSLKRAKLGIQILENKSDQKSKFDLFQRLNSGGVMANSQELRNCAIIMTNEQFYDVMTDLKDNIDFRSLIRLGPDSVKKANDYEHISRIIAFGFTEYETGIDIEDFVKGASKNGPFGMKLGV